MTSESGKDIRWKQRFQNFEKAFYKLESSVLKVNELSDLEKEDYFPAIKQLYTYLKKQ